MGIITAGAGFGSPAARITAARARFGSPAARINPAPGSALRPRGPRPAAPPGPGAWPW